MSTQYEMWATEGMPYLDTDDVHWAGDGLWWDDGDTAAISIPAVINIYVDNRTIGLNRATSKKCN